jgi:hypothetical protein
MGGLGKGEGGSGEGRGDTRATQPHDQLYASLLACAALRCVATFLLLLATDARRHCYLGLWVFFFVSFKGTAKVL